MATIIQGSPDLRYQALEQGLGSGVANYFAERQKKQQQDKFLNAFRAVDQSPTYEDAVKNIALSDPEILANKDAMQILQEHIDKKFPQQDTLEVVDKGGQKQTITYAKGRPPSDVELASKGFIRPGTIGFGTYYNTDDKTGQVTALPDQTRDQATSAVGGKPVFAQEEVGAATQLENAYSARLSAKARLQKAAQGPKQEKATQFDQEIAATMDRLGVGQNEAVTIVKNRDQTKKDFRQLYSQQYAGMLELNPASRGHIVNAESILEPGLAISDSPETVIKLMSSDLSYNLANDPNVTGLDAETKKKAEQDFMRITGIPAGDAQLKQIIPQAQALMQNGEIKSVPVKDAGGKTLYNIQIAKVGGRVVVMGRTNAK